jgi:hypothetical protein
MNNYVCLIQEGQFADQNRKALAEGLKKIGSECFGDDAEATEIDWVVARKGFAFKSEGLSTSSIVERSVPVGLPQDQREVFLNKVCNFWQQETGCSVDEIMVLAWDGPLPKQL